MIILFSAAFLFVGPPVMRLFIVYVGVFVCDFYSLYMNCGTTTDVNVQDVRYGSYLLLSV